MLNSPTKLRGYRPTVQEEEVMKYLRYLTVFILIVMTAIPVLAGRREAIKSEGALLSSAKIALYANPPRVEEALELVNTVLSEHGPHPEAFYYKGNIFGEYANQEYDLEKKIAFLDTMSLFYDSLSLSCNNKDVKKKWKKKCDDFIKTVDSVKAYYWRDNYNNGVQILGNLDDKYDNDINNAFDSTAKEAAIAAKAAAIDSTKLYFRAAILVIPDSSRCYEGLGLVYDREGIYDSSAIWFTKAHEMKPDDPNMVQNIAYAYIQMRDWGNAVKWFIKLTDMIPDDGSTMMNIAACYNNLEQYDSAHVYNMKALAINPNDPVANIDIGKYWLVNSRVYSDSVKHYQDIEDTEGAKRNIALRDQMFDSSSVYFKKGLELDPENMDALTNFGIVSLIRGNYEDALSVFQKLSELEPFVKEHWIDQGDCLIQLQKFEEAIAPFEKASELDPGDPKIWNVLSELYTSSGQTEKAKEAKAKATELENL
ncbi:MAG TPA: tetratricopeptide repeat protein [candidate division Zixibacteria bacterium]|nr:tetratricopeptide repeat protein [candidate division Zixibacteria bacterium]